MSEPMYLPVKVTKNFKVTAVETVYKTHDGTNTVLEQVENVILDEAVFQATSEELATYAALKQIEDVGKVDMSNLKVTSRLF
jgi:hypothetical protein